jgi:hypothetical protein
MTKASAIINRAAEILGYKDPDEALSTTDSANFLAVLNDMLDGWNTQRLFIVAVADIAQSVSTSPITIGTGGTINIARPIKMMDGAFTRINGDDYPITWIERTQYDAINNKAQTGTRPEFGYYDAAVPLGSIYLYPVPTSAIELHIQVQTQLTEFADLSTTDYNLAAGYRKALAYSLAEELAPGRRPIEVTTQRIAANARRAIRRTNARAEPQGTAVPSGYAAFMAGF